MTDIIEKERRLLALLSQAITLLETGGRMPMREVEERRRDLREFYAEVFGASMLAKREKLRAEVLGQ